MTRWKPRGRGRSVISRWSHTPASAAAAPRATCRARRPRASSARTATCERPGAGRQLGLEPVARLRGDPAQARGAAGEHLPARDLGRAVPARVDEHASASGAPRGDRGPRARPPRPALADRAVVALAPGQAAVEQQPPARGELREHGRRAPADEHVAVGLHAGGALVEGRDPARVLVLAQQPDALRAPRRRRAPGRASACAGRAGRRRCRTARCARARRAARRAGSRSACPRPSGSRRPCRRAATAISPVVAVELVERARVARGDDQVAVRVLLDGVDVEVVPRARARRAA